MDRKKSEAGMKNKVNVIRLKEWEERQRQRGRERDISARAAEEQRPSRGFVTFRSFISPSSCTISSLLLSCKDDILCSSSSFLCLKDTHSLSVSLEERKEAPVYFEELELL